MPLILRGNRTCRMGTLPNFPTQTLTNYGRTPLYTHPFPQFKGWKHYPFNTIRKVAQRIFPSVSSFFNFPLSTRYFSSVFKMISFFPYYQNLLSSMFPPQANTLLSCNVSTSWKDCLHLRLDSTHYNFYSHHTTKMNFSEASNNSDVNQQFSFLVLLDLLTKHQHSPGFLSLF